MAVKKQQAQDQADAVELAQRKLREKEAAAQREKVCVWVYVFGEQNNMCVIVLGISCSR